MKKCTGLSEQRYRFDSDLMSVLNISKPEPEIVLSGMPCRLLKHMINAEGSVISVEEFKREVWKDSLVTDGSVKDYIAQIRSALNDSATDPEFIETIRGRGYRYLGGIAFDSRTTLDTDLYPTIAVVPPLHCGDHCNSYKMAGQIIASNIIESLSRSPVLNVISCISTRCFSGPDVDIEKIGNALAADYVLTGIYSCATDKLTLHTELSQVRTASVIHATTLSSPVDVWNDASNDNLQLLSKTLISEILGREIDMVNASSFDSLPLHSLMINAIVGMHSSSQRAFAQAEGVLKLILKRKQNNTAALALLAQWHLMHMNRQRGLNLTVDSKYTDNVFRFAEKALEQNPLHPHANAIYGSLEARLNNNTDKALEHHIIAMTGNPNHPLNHCLTASAYTYYNDFNSKKQAIRHANLAIKLSPYDPQLYLFKTVAATANYHAGNLDIAYENAIESHRMNSNHTSNLRTLISVLVDMGKWNEVGRLRKELRQLDPDFNVSLYRKYGPGMGSEFGQRIANNLEAAGVPAH